MASQGNPYPQSYSTSDSFESILFPNVNPEEWKEHLYNVENEVVNDLRRHTRAYVKSIGGLPLSLIYPEENTRRKIVPSWKIQCWYLSLIQMRKC